jgi:hypothetical protein
MNVASQLDTAELAACSQNADGVTTGALVPPDQSTRTVTAVRRRRRRAAPALYAGQPPCRVGPVLHLRNGSHTSTDTIEKFASVSG